MGCGPVFILLHCELFWGFFPACCIVLCNHSRNNIVYFVMMLFAEIEVRDDIKLESDKKLEKLESFLGRLNSKGEEP